MAGIEMKSARRSEKVSVAATARVSPAAAWRAITGSDAEARAIPNTPSGNSITRSA